MISLPKSVNEPKLKVGIAADHGGFELKEYLVSQLRQAGYEITDYGNRELDPNDDFPDFVIPLGFAIVSQTVERGIAICGSGVGAGIIANKISGIRASLITEVYSAHQGVEHDDMNLLCLGGLVVGHKLAGDLVNAFLKANYRYNESHQRRLQKIVDFENRKLA
jgi:ribose 5-phosphate isomerase B